MQNDSGGRGVNPVSLALGAILILLGIAFLFGQVVEQLFHFDVGHYLWPVFVLVPGMLILAFALLTESGAGEPFSILGGMATMAGLLLFFQNITGLWATWAYAWALVVPGGAGLGLSLYGLLRSKPDKLREGIRLVTAAGGIFVVGLLFFELVIGVSGFGLGRYGLGLLLIVLGIFALVRNLLPHRTRAE